MLSFVVTIEYIKPGCSMDSTVGLGCKSFREQTRCRALVRQNGFGLRHSTRWYDDSMDVEVIRLV